jgi:hypothetical protein
MQYLIEQFEIENFGRVIRRADELIAQKSSEVTIDTYLLKAEAQVKKA